MRTGQGVHSFTGLGVHAQVKGQGGTVIALMAFNNCHQFLLRIMLIACISLVSYLLMSV